MFYVFFCYSELSSENWQSVAERISELKKASNQFQENIGYTYLDPSKTTRVSNPTLKVIQKNAVHSYFQRQQASVRESLSRSRLTTSQSSIVHVKSCSRPKSLYIDMNPTKSSQRSSVSGYIMSSQRDSNSNLSSIGSLDSKTSVSTNNLDTMSNAKENSSNLFKSSKKLFPVKCDQQQHETPPKPPPRNRQSLPIRRTSSASEYSSARDKVLTAKQHLSKDLLGPMILGSVISIDDWVPERPPKNPSLRIPSPELPPPPAAEIMQELDRLDEPLPPPPEEMLQRPIYNSDQSKKVLLVPCRRNSFAGQSNRSMYRSNGLENLTSMAPPAIPKKPIDLQKRSSGSRVNLGFKDRIQGDINQLQSKVPLKLNDTRISVRKRPHNMQNTLGIPLVHEKQQPPAPPLKPRMLCQQ